MKYFMKLNLQINKKMIKMRKNKGILMRLLGIERCPGGVMWCLGVSWGNKTDPHHTRDEYYFSLKIRINPSECMWSVSGGFIGISRDA